MMSVQEILERRDVKSAFKKWEFKNEDLLRQTAKMFTRYPSYLSWLLRCEFVSEEMFSEFATELADVVNNHHQWLKHVPSGVMTYTTLDDMEMLRDYFKVFKHYEELKKLSSVLVKKQSNLLFDRPFMMGFGEMIDIISNGGEYDDSFFGNSPELCERFWDLPKAERTNFIKAITPIESPEELYRQFNKLLCESYKWDRDSFLAYIRENPLLYSGIIYDENNIIVADCRCFEDCFSICGKGVTPWCITRDRGQFDGYMDDGCKQYIILDFNLPEEDPLSIVGLTYDVGCGSVAASHIRNNCDVFNSSVQLDDERMRYDDIIDGKMLPWSLFFEPAPSYIENELEWSKECICGQAEKEGLEKTYEKGDAVVFRIEEKTENYDGKLQIPAYSEPYPFYVYYDFSKGKMDNGSVVILTYYENIGGADTFLDAYNQIGAKRTLKWFKRISGLSLNDIIPEAKASSVNKLYHYCREKDMTSAEKTLNEVKVDEAVAGTTIWDIILRFGNSKLLRQILERPEFNGVTANGWGNTFLPEALSVQRFTGDKELQSVILDYVENASIDTLKNESAGPLGIAICCENEDVVRKLLGRGFSLLDDGDMLMRTPLENLVIHRGAFDEDFVRNCIENIDGYIPLGALRAIKDAGLLNLIKNKK